MLKCHPNDKWQAPTLGVVDMVGSVDQATNLDQPRYLFLYFSLNFSNFLKNLFLLKFFNLFYFSCLLFFLFYFYFYLS